MGLKESQTGRNKPPVWALAAAAAALFVSACTGPDAYCEVNERMQEVPVEELDQRLVETPGADEYACDEAIIQR